MNKRKLLTLAMTLCMVAILAIGGTLAYFTDTDSKTNVFTVGNVDIHIHEWMEDEDGNWENYENQELAPIAQDKAPFNKLVETFNDGENDAYIRTFVTCPTELYWKLGYGFNAGSKAADATNILGGTRHYLDSWTDLGETTVNGESVHIFVCEHKDAIAKNDSILSLTKVWVYESVDNDEIGGSFNVEVYSEAIQADNLTYDEAMTSLNAGKTVLAHAAELFNN